MRLALSTLALFALLPASAWGAGVVAPDPFGPIYTGDGGPNTLTINDEAASPTLTRVTFFEPGISETDPDPAGCTKPPDPPERVVCVTSDLNRVIASMGGGVDSVTYDGTQIDHFLHGQAGNDTLVGSPGVADANGGDLADSLLGGADVDVLRGREGADRLNAEGGDGDDADGGPGGDLFYVDGADGNGDRLRGGEGIDKVDLQGVGGAFADLTAGTVGTLSGTSRQSVESIEDIRGSDLADTLIGSPGVDSLDGDLGNDTIDGRPGGDFLQGGDGDDTLEARDGEGDRVFGGLDIPDTCRVDQVDLVYECESVAVSFVQPPGAALPPPPAVPAADQAGPRCRTIGLKSRYKRRSVLRSGLAFRVSCNETGRVSLALNGKLKRLRRGTRLAAAGDVTLGTTSGRLNSGFQRAVRLRVSKRLRSLLGRSATLRVVIQATDGLGNTRAISKRVRVR